MNIQRVCSMAICVVFTTGCASVGKGSFNLSFMGLSTDPNIQMGSAHTQPTTGKQSGSDAFMLRYSVPLEKAQNSSIDPLKETPRSFLKDGVSGTDVLWIGLAVLTASSLSSSKKDRKNASNLSSCLADARTDSQRRQCNLTFGY